MSLSPRGRAAEKASDGLHIWKAVGDLYHPTTSPTGFATLGVSENTLMAQELSEHLHKHFKRLAERYQFVVHWANTNGVPYARGTNAAFFLWADLGSVWKKHNPGALNEDLDDFLTKLFLDHKVYISSGKDFGSEQPGWFRLVFSQDEVQLKTGLERVAAALRPMGNCQVIVMEKTVRIISPVGYIDVRFRIEDDGSLDVRGVTKLLGFKKTMICASARL